MGNDESRINLLFGKGQAQLLPEISLLMLKAALTEHASIILSSLYARIGILFRTLAPPAGFHHYTIQICYAVSNLHPTRYTTALMFVYKSSTQNKHQPKNPLGINLKTLHLIISYILPTLPYNYTQQWGGYLLPDKPLLLRLPQKLSQKADIDWDFFPQPGCPLGMISERIIGVWVKENAKWPAVYHKPGYEGAEMDWGQDVYFEHCEGVGANGLCNGKRLVLYMLGGEEGG